ncbi:MAG: ATP/GTP-binding protein [Thermoplasmata archaeon]|nr:ATP/GTP-binding protein [Thermoplasmata archaeon]
MKIFVIGPAGCGKSSFVKSFSEYLGEGGEDVRCVNLDPATDPVFKADKDVRSFVKTDEIMKKYGLGINGGLLKSMDEVLFYVKDLDVSGDYVIYDTPGQMEIFIYSSSGRRIIEKLSDKTTAGLFLMDSTLVTDSESFLSAVMQNVIVSLRLSIPTATVLTKNDVADVDVEKVMEEIPSKNSVLAELLEKTSYFIEYTTLSQRVVKVSSFDETGFDDVYSLLNEMFCACGDLS